MTDTAPQPPAAPQPKKAILQCVCKSGQIIVKDAGAEPPKTILIPLNLTGDPRLFVDKGQLVQPFVTVEFAYRRTIDVSGIAIALYHEVAFRAFDPKDMQPIAVRSLEQAFAELNSKPE